MDTPTTPADRLRHAFQTFLGLPPDTDTPPACGALLSRAYGRTRPIADCAMCNHLLAIAQSSRAIDTVGK